MSGTTPLQWLLHQRVLRAQELLEQTDDTVETIAMHVGMGSAATLRRHFSRVTRISPTGFHQHFRAIERTVVSKPSVPVVEPGD